MSDHVGNVCPIKMARSPRITLSRRCQLGLELVERQGWGGKRPGAGRPRLSARPLVAHRERPSLSANHPAHVTLRVHDHVWNLRSRRSFRVIETALNAVRDRGGFAVAHFSVQGNHLHLLVEADDAVALASGMKAVSVRIARGLNRIMGRRGAVFLDRYHAHALRTPREVRNALAYVLLNRRSHVARTGRPAPAPALDPYSSASAFDGWRGHASPSVASAGSPGCPVTSAKTWLLRVGWRRHGLIGIGEVPARQP